MLPDLLGDDTFNIEPSREIFSLVRNLFARQDVKDALDAARVISTFADRPPLHRTKELFPDVPPALVYNQPILSPDEPTTTLDHDTKLECLAAEKRCPEFRRGRLFVCQLEQQGEQFNASFRAGHNVDNGLTEDEMNEMWASGRVEPDHYLISQSFRGMYALFVSNNIEIYALALDGEKSRTKFDQEIMTRGQTLLKALSVGLTSGSTTNGMSWVNNHTTNQKFLVITDVEYRPQHLAEITYSS